MLPQLKIFLDGNPSLKKIIIYIYSKTYGQFLKNKQNTMFLKNGQKVLEQVDKVFKEIGIDYWLDFGTLLGAIRNQSLIEHDFDIDLGMFLSDYSEEHEFVFKKYGLKKTRSFTIDGGKYGREESYSYLGVTLDLFYYTGTENDYAYCHLFKPLEGKSRDKTIQEIGGLVPKEFLLRLNSIGRIDFLENSYPIPQPVDKHLTDIYGDSYMIEDPSWETGSKERKNITILVNKIGIRKFH